MRRSLPLALCALALTVPVLAVSPSSAADDDRSDPTALDALTTAQEVLAGVPAEPAPSSPGEPAATDPAPSATIALRDLFVALPRLSRTDRAAAEAMLSRPLMDVRSCGDHVCVHHDTSGADKTTEAWAATTLDVMNGVWTREIDDLGYRPPAPDGTSGGNDKLDVYLEDIGPYLYGYCAPDARVAGTQRRATGYCVLDNDYARSQFDAVPKSVLKVTAAHEFFHASQFNYDYREDVWFMEASATWMEEQYADGVNDNRQYLPAGQLRLPRQSLDTYDQAGFNQYGNWPLFEYLASRWDRDLVRTAWEKAVGKKRYSLKAIGAALPRGQHFREVYADFAAANTTPSASYDEGKNWPRPATVKRRLGRDRSTGWLSYSVDHLANVPVKALPRSGVKGSSWHLRVRVDGPAAKTHPAATAVVVPTSGAPRQVPVRLGDSGNGVRVVSFDNREIEKVFVVLTNASSRFDCWKNDPTYSCKGNPRDDDKRFRVNLTTFQRS